MTNFLRSGEGWKGILEDMAWIPSFCQAIYARFPSSSTQCICTIGRDNRPQSEELANEFAHHFAKLGAFVNVVYSPISSPLFSHHLSFLKSDFGLYISASHRPWDWIGVKLKTPAGNMCPDRLYKEIDYAFNNISFHRKVNRQFSGRIEKIDKEPFVETYLNKMKKIIKKSTSHLQPLMIIDTDFISHKDLYVIAKRLGVNVIQYHSNITINSSSYLDPITVLKGVDEKSNNKTLIIALDPDGDSSAAFIGKVPSLGPQLIATLCAKYLLYYQFSSRVEPVIFLELGMCRTLEEIFRKWGCQVKWIDGRFVYLYECLQAFKGLLGADENGNIGHILSSYQRDGIMATLLAYMAIGILEKTQSSLVNIIRDLKKRIYVRMDMPITKTKIGRAVNQLADRLNAIKLDERNSGTRIIYLRNKSWILLRPSTTMSVIRLRGEFDNESHRIFSNIISEISSSLENIDNSSIEKKEDI